jgi:hypothetical protein
MSLWSNPFVNAGARILGGPAGNDIMNSILTQETNDTNFNLAMKNYNLQKNQMMWNREQTEWEKAKYSEALMREDTAVQRRTADLQAAGINPLLAAGQAATTMAPISPNHVQAPDAAPQKNYTPFDMGYDSVLSTISQIEGIRTQGLNNDILEKELGKRGGQATQITIANRIALIDEKIKALEYKDKKYWTEDEILELKKDIELVLPRDQTKLLQNKDSREGRTWDAMWEKFKGIDPAYAAEGDINSIIDNIFEVDMETDGLPIGQILKALLKTLLRNSNK